MLFISVSIRRSDCILISLSSLSRRETLTDNLGVVGGEKIDENLNKPKRKDVTRKLGTQNNQDDATTNNMNKGTSIYDAGLERLPDKTNCMSSLHDAICRPQSPSVDDLVPSNPMEKRKGVPTPTQVIMSYVKKIHGSPVYNHYEATIPCSVTGRQVYNHYEATIPCTVNESKASESGIKVEVRCCASLHILSLDFLFIFRILSYIFCLNFYQTLGLLMLMGTLTDIDSDFILSYKVWLKACLYFKNYCGFIP